ncbi:MAG: FliH/SctL family protein [Dethiobacteria bacterium]|jgi:flagellar assembly protein FliH|nr:hypothetical protein [Bacillota bacterium]
MLLSTKVFKRVEVQGARLYTVDDFPQKDKPAPEATEGESKGKRGPAFTREELAQQEAERILEQAQQKAEALFEEYRHRGWEEGYREGQRQAQEEQAKFTARLQKEQQKAAETLVMLLRYKNEIVKEAEKQLVDLAVEIAETLIGQQLQLSPETVVEIARQGLEKLLDSQKAESLRVYLNPEDYARAREQLASLQEKLPSDMDFETRSDPTLSRGSCRLETEEGFVELLLDQQLTQLKALFSRFNTLGRSEPEGVKEPEARRLRKVK